MKFTNRLIDVERTSRDLSFELNGRESFSDDKGACLTVSELTRMIKGVVDSSFPRVRVLGEVSSLSRPSSGHAYFTLKDETSQLDVAVWRSVLARSSVELKNGAKIACMGSVEVYAPHGRYKLIASSLEAVGIGNLEQQFRRLEAKLRKEGLFAPERKRRLPDFIRRIGVATSPTSAAIHDFLKTLALRSKRIDVVVAPTRVQGEGAAEEIAAALKLLNEKRDALRLDAIVLIRGGGSMEDLWAFNEEAAVRAVAASNVPVATGIGHEIDVTLCDLAADVHALTPTAAATAVAPDDSKYEAQLLDWLARMERVASRRVQLGAEMLDRMENRRVFIAPGEAITQRREERLTDMEERLKKGWEKTFDRKESAFKEIVGKMSALSPLAVLSRGYSVTKRLADGKLLRRASDASPGDVLETLLDDGTIRSVVVGD